MEKSGNGLCCAESGDIWEYIDEEESDFMYEEIFTRRSYFEHEISLRPGDVVFDVGANIGLFTLFCVNECNNLTIHTFEPLPPIVEVLRRNISQFQCSCPDCELVVHPIAISNAIESSKQFAFYPSYPAESSCNWTERAAQREILLQSLIASTATVTTTDNSQILTSVDGRLTDSHSVDIISPERVAVDKPPQYFDCPVSTVTVMAQQLNLSAIHLLKIDVEGEELAVLQGISPSTWLLIHQVVVEVHDVNGRLRAVEELLSENGFRINVEKQCSEVSDEDYMTFIPEALQLYLVYAKKI